MPPEPQPWERRELAGYAGRKHERPPGGDAVGAGAGAAAAAAPPGRWRDSPYRSPRSNFARSSPRRPPPGQFRQGSGYYQVPPEESGVGRVCTPSRSPPARFAGGRSGGRDGRGTGSYRCGTPLEPGSSWRRNQDLPSPVTAPRSLAVPVSTVSYPYPSSQPPVVDELLGSAESNPKTFQWPRPCSMTLSKLSVTGLDEVGVEASVTDRKDTPIGSPLMSPLVSDDGAAPRKKARLSWGQGLAKREKKTIERSLDTVGQSGVVQGDSSTQAAADDTGTNPASLGDCASLATLGSAISEASSAVQEQKPSVKDSNNDASHPIDASGKGLQDCAEEFTIKLDPLDPTVLGNLTSLLADLLQHEDACLAGSSFMRHTAMSKVLVLKKDISKELEKTECEIDLLENELKVLHGDDTIHPCESSSLQGTCSLERCSESADITLNLLLDSTQSKDTVLVSSLPLAGELLLRTNFSENDAETLDIGDVCDGRVVLKCVKPTSVDDFEPPRLSGCTVDGGESLTVVDSYGDSICLDAGSSVACADHEASPKVKDDNLVDAIIASNRVAARKSSQVFAKFMSTYHPRYGTREPDYILSCRKNVEHVREKLAVHRRRFIFKERVLSLKFRAFHHLWKEDMHLVSIRKNKPKAQRHLEPCARASQKHRTSIRSRFMLPAGNLTLVPTSEIVSFASKLLSDSQIKLYRKSLKMPALILDDMEKKYSRFISSNGLVEDPSVVEKERATVNPWTQEEKNIFMEMLGTYGKDFTKISSFLAYKTTADCIEFYYKNHKSEHFRYVKKRLDLTKQPQFLCSNPCLITSQNKWNREENAVSLDILGDASVVAANSTGKIRNQRKYARRSVSGSYHDFKVMRGNIHSLDRESAVDNSSLEKEIAAADVLAGICGSLSSEAVNSCVTSAIHPAEKMDDVIMDTPFTPEVAKKIDEETCSDDDFGEAERVDWTDYEKSLLIRALIMYGKDFARISHFVGTRSMEQCKIFFSKARKCLGLDLVHRGPGITDALMIDMNEEQSDADGAGGQELDSAICSTQSCSKLDFDVTQSVGNACSEGLVPGGSIPVHSETVATCEPCDEAGHDTGSVRVFIASAEDVLLKSNAGVEVQVDMTGVSPFDSSKSEVHSQPFMMPESAAVSGQQIKEDKDCNKSGYVSSSETGLMVSHSLAIVPNSQHQIPLEVLSYLQRTPHIQPREVWQPLHILRGYPLQALNHKEATSRVSEMPMMLESILKENGFPQTNQLFCPAKINEKNSGSQLLSLQSGVHNPLQGENKLEAHLQAHSESLCVETEAHSNRTGDVKLFGQILTHPSFQQYDNPSSQDCDSQTLSPKHNGSLAVKQMMGFNDVMTTSRLGSSDNLVKARTGNRISLPESSLMLTEYQSTASSLYPEMGSGHNLKSVLTDYQQAYLQILAEDGEALNNYSELQKRHIFETVSGFQHPGRAMLGVNLGGGILVGAAGGASNHAALKMHYTGRAKILQNEVDSWNGNVESK